jgi:dUTP pyrophosphatase
LLKETKNKIDQMEIVQKSDDEESAYDTCEEIPNEYFPDDIMVIRDDENKIKDANLAIKIYNDQDKGKMPERTYETDAGFDVRYTGDEPLVIHPQQTTLIDLYIAMEIPVGTVCQLMSRSSLAQKGIDVKGGTIDSGYTGNISVILFNRSHEDYTIQPDDKIAQAVFLQLANI